jgi:hypothetical protein
MSGRSASCVRTACAGYRIVHLLLTRRHTLTPFPIQRRILTKFRPTPVDKFTSPTARSSRKATFKASLTIRVKGKRLSTVGCSNRATFNHIGPIDRATNSPTFISQRTSTTSPTRKLISITTVTAVMWTRCLIRQRTSTPCLIQPGIFITDIDFKYGSRMSNIS